MWAVTDLEAEQTVLKRKWKAITVEWRPKGQSRAEVTRIKNMAQSRERPLNTMEILINLFRSVVVGTQ